MPFPVESYLSGVQTSVPANGSVWYRRHFTAPRSTRLLLHFEASDWHTTVWINGQQVGEHKGGFDPFSFDITGALKARGRQELVVRVIDPTDDGPQPLGKQTRNPRGIWYTPSTGIWQTVWLEPVPATYIRSFELTPKNSGALTIAVDLDGSVECPSSVVVTAESGETVELPVANGKASGTLHVSNPSLWSPDSPRLYKLNLTAGADVVQSYCAFREISVGKDADGITRLMLNGAPIFMIGPLDQGFWPDGLFTAPTEQAMKYDLDVTKRLGFNTVRKHVKVEPRTWYAHCDRIGLLVWQDMPSGDGHIRPEDPDLTRTPESNAIFETELAALVNNLYNSPSLVTWVLFNEGWGQYDTVRLADWLRRRDPSRLHDAVTGWSDRGVGDMHDWHIYPGPDCPKPEPTRASVLGEFGGIGLHVPGHMWEKKAWGYENFGSKAELGAKFEAIFGSLALLVNDPGCSAAIYTQTTDVESEANGLLTYDREVLKLDAKRIRAAITKLKLS